MSHKYNLFDMLFSVDMSMNGSWLVLGHQYDVLVYSLSLYEDQDNE